MGDSKILIYDYVDTSEITLFLQLDYYDEMPEGEAYAELLQEYFAMGKAADGRHMLWKVRDPSWLPHLDSFVKDMIRWLLSRPWLRNGSVMKQGSVEIRYET